jgi:hypothetical protein
MPIENAIPFVDAFGNTTTDLSLQSGFRDPAMRELRAIRIMLGMLLQEMSGRDVDISEFQTNEALEG